jgi:hypothetical protein
MIERLSLERIALGLLTGQVSGSRATIVTAFETAQLFVEVSEQFGQRPVRTTGRRRPTDHSWGEDT